MVSIRTTSLRRRLIRWAIGIACCTLFALFVASQSVIVSPQLGLPQRQWGEIIRASLIFSYTWGLFSLVIFALARRFPFERRRWPIGVLAHLLAIVLFSCVYTAVCAIWRTHIAGSPIESESWVARFGMLLRTTSHSNVIVYSAILGVYKAVGFYRKYRNRELRASQLEAQLAQAHLAALKSQLQPHFLFNTLNAISALVRDAPRDAERMIARLSDLLRMTLENVGVEEVPLRDELEFVHKYLEIEQTRFGERLVFRENIDPCTLDVMVPTLVLQPLVENAVRHGVAAQSTPCTIEITATRTGESLRLHVRDSGPGPSAGNDERHGIGLANTQARLQHLYGDRHRFEMNNGDDGGCVVRIVIPLDGRAARAFDGECAP